MLNKRVKRKWWQINMKDRIIWMVEHGSWVILFGVWAVFTLLSDKFLTASNLVNLGVQSTSTAILAIGMTFVLLTAGVDLSVGAIMFVTAAVAGKLAMSGASLTVIIPVMIAIGLIGGLINGVLVAKLKIVPFIATLGMLYIGRGLGLWISETRAMNLPDGFLQLGSAAWLSIPFPLWLLSALVVIGHVTLVKTPFGRRIMATGFDQTLAERAGVSTRQVILLVYLISGGLAAVAALVSLTQLGAVSPTFGENRELLAIAAAVLGGTSLFGGRGSIFPGAIIGAVTLQSVENGLVLINANPYLYPLILSAIIFVSVLLDSGRGLLLQSLERRPVFYR